MLHVYLLIVANARKAGVQRQKKSAENCVCVCVCVCVGTHIYVYIYMHIHVCIYIYIHTHMYVHGCVKHIFSCVRLNFLLPKSTPQNYSPKFTLQIYSHVSKFTPQIYSHVSKFTPQNSLACE